MTDSGLLNIREYRDDDEKQVKHIVSLATIILRKTYQPNTNKENVIKNTNNMPQKNEIKTLVAESNTNIVGLVQYLKNSDSVHIQGLAVDPKFYNKGVARALVNKINSIAKDAQFDHLTLTTIKETGNIIVFKKLGFKSKSEKLSLDYISELYENLWEVDMFKTIK
jgi:ribosomal protein S18 acetylase RimI-like enzyme